MAAALASSPWRCAMEEELRALAQNHTWDLVLLPAGKHLVGSRWVYAIKENSDGSLERHKARMVAKGFTQKYGVDYQETFAPVAKMNTIHILLALVAHRGWTLQQYDVKNAFLHGNLIEEIYMALPPGYYSWAPSTPASVVCRLWKSLYGLKQSPRAWFARFTTAMLTRGYRQCNGDHTLFFCHSTSGGVVILLVCVDDIIITGDDKSAIGELTLYLGSEFAIKHLGPLRYFVGIEVAYSSNGLFICHRKYMINLLQDLAKEDSRPLPTPIEANHRLGADDNEALADPGSYQRLVGKADLSYSHSTGYCIQSGRSQPIHAYSPCESPTCCAPSPSLP